MYLRLMGGSLSADVWPCMWTVMVPGAFASTITDPCNRSLIQRHWFSRELSGILGETCAVLTLRLQIAQSKFYLYTLGPKVVIFCLLSPMV